MSVLKMAMLQSWVERTAMQKSAIRNSWWKIFIQWRYNSTVLLTDKNIYSSHTKNPKYHQLYTPAAATKKKNVATKRLHTRYDTIR